jgi:hypothetical protein
MLAFDPAERITVPDALAHPWLSSYHDVNDEPICHNKFDRWRQVEELETIEEFREALWNEIQEYRREVRSIIPDVPSQPASLERQRPASHSPAVSPVVARPSLPEVPEETSSTLGSPAHVDGTNGKEHLEVPFPAKQPDEPEAIAPLPADPVVTYARRSSMLRSQSYSTYNAPAPRSRHHPIPSFDGYYTRNESAQDMGASASAISTGTGTALPATPGGVPFPGAGYASYVMPARSRTMSTAAGEIMSRKLLRTLSTVSIHETGAGLPGGLAEVAPIGKYILEKRGPTEVTEADKPPSDLPEELGGDDEKVEVEMHKGKEKMKDGRDRRAGMFTVG